MEEKQKNSLIPKHRKISQEEVKQLLEKHGLDTTSKLPKIKIKEKGLTSIEKVEVGSVIEILRKSFAGECKYYRVVIE